MMVIWCFKQQKHFIHLVSSPHLLVCTKRQVNGCVQADLVTRLPFLMYIMKIREPQHFHTDQ